MRKAFELAPKIKQPRIVPYMLEGEATPEILAEVNRIIDSEYNGNPNLKVLQLKKIGGIQTLVGSSPPILPVISRVIAPQFGVMRPEEVETTLQDGDAMGVEGNHYIDYSLVLDFSGKNHELAVEVFRKLPKELRDLDRLPALMVNYGLGNSPKGNYGVMPVYQDGTELRTAKILSQRGSFDSKDAELTRSGLPSKIGRGTRTLYTFSQGTPSEESLGLVRLCLYRDLDLGALDEILADSVEDGRVACVRRGKAA